jgi:3',5'-cyclic AMP phosphodiesterase CpdA
MSLKMNRPITLFHLSDVHFGLEDQGALAWASHEIAAQRPDAVIITGDLTMRARTREFAAAARWIAGLDVPVLVEPGNHDLPGYHRPSRYLRPLARFDAFRAATQRMVDLPGLVLLGLNTNVAAQPRLNWSKGRITSAALEACLAQIDALPAGTRVLVMAHHPLREAGTHGTALTRGGAAALAQLARRKVLGVLSGHVHDAFDIVEQTPSGPVRMIGAGTLSRRLRSTPASFNALTFDGDALTVQVRNQQGVPSGAMLVDEVPEDAEPPHTT